MLCYHHTPEMQAAYVIERDSIEQHSEEIETPLTPTVPQERLIIESLLEDLEDRAKIMQRVQAVEDISQASEHQRTEKIKLWADRLEIDPVAAYTILHLDRFQIFSMYELIKIVFDYGSLDSTFTSSKCWYRRISAISSI